MGLNEFVSEKSSSMSDVKNVKNPTINSNEADQV